MVVNIPPGVTHSAKALTDCYVFDCFNPVREDFKKLIAYMTLLLHLVADLY